MVEANAILRYLLIYPLLYLISFIDSIINLFKNSKKTKQFSSSIQVAKDSSSSTYRSPKGLRLFKLPDDNKLNLYLKFQECTKKYPDLETMGVRELISIDEEVQDNGKTFKKLNQGDYKWMKYSRILKRVDNLANGLLKIGLKSGDNIVLFSETRPEWMITALACFKINVVVVTQYATLGLQALTFGINQTEAAYVFASGDTLTKIENILTQIPKVTHLVVFKDKFSQDLNVFRSKKMGGSTLKMVYSIDEVEEIGETSAKMEYTSPDKSDLSIIMYTSGSTGNPKGVMMTHENILTVLEALKPRLLPNATIDDLYIGYLPLAHILELASEITMIINGVRIGYSSPVTITDQSTAVKRGQKGDLTTLRPTIMTAVPAILERLTKAIKLRVDEGSPIKYSLFNKAYEIKFKKLKNGKTSTLLDKIVFSKIKTAILGDRLSFIACGGAILNEDVHDYAQTCLCPIVQAYGLSETCAGGSTQFVGETKCNEVGGVAESCEIKLVDWIEGNYRSSDKPNPRGEIWIGGANVTMGYYKMEEKSKEDFHLINGLKFFSTGDIGEMTSNGVLKIIDRKKDLVKLQGGEYLSLNKIEAVIKLLPLVENCCVVADGRKSYCVCLIQPNLKKMEGLISTSVSIANENQVNVECSSSATAHNVARRSSIEIAADLISQIENGKFMLKFNKDLMDHCLKHGLEKFEIPLKSKLVKEAWLPITGLVTDSLKIKRREVENFYSKEIELLYSSN